MKEEEQDIFTPYKEPTDNVIPYFRDFQMEITKDAKLGLLDGFQFIHKSRFACFPISILSSLRDLYNFGLFGMLHPFKQ